MLLLALSPALAIAADVMFEGYFRIELDGKHIGYSIQRYEFDPKARQFKSISFMRTQIGEDSTQESLISVVNDKIQPVSYQHTLQEGKSINITDASFKGEVMTLKKSDGKKVETQTHKIPKGTFLSSFLLYMMLQKELKVNEAFKYSAVAEEESNSYWGKAMIDSKEDKSSYQVLRVLNSFKTDKFITTVAAIPDPAKPNRYQKAELTGVELPAKNLRMRLVTNAIEATEGFSVPNKALLTMFTTMPTGKANLLSKPEAAAKAPEAAPVPAKPGSKTTPPPKSEGGSGE